MFHTLVPNILTQGAEQNRSPISCLISSDHYTLEHNYAAGNPRRTGPAHLPAYRPQLCGHHCHLVATRRAGSGHLLHWSRKPRADDPKTGLGYKVRCCAVGVSGLLLCSSYFRMDSEVKRTCPLPQRSVYQGLECAVHGNDSLDGLEGGAGQGVQAPVQETCHLLLLDIGPCDKPARRKQRGRLTAQSRPQPKRAQPIPAHQVLPSRGVSVPGPLSLRCELCPPFKADTLGHSPT